MRRITQNTPYGMAGAMIQHNERGLSLAAIPVNVAGPPASPGWTQEAVMPTAFISKRSAQAARPSAATLASQIQASHPSRRSHRLALARLGRASSVIALSRLDFAAEDVVRPCGIHQDDGDDEQGAHQGETLALGRAGRLP